MCVYTYHEFHYSSIDRYMNLIDVLLRPPLSCARTSNMLDNNNNYSSSDNSNGHDRPQRSSREVNTIGICMDSSIVIVVYTSAVEY